MFLLYSLWCQLTQVILAIKQFLLCCCNRVSVYTVLLLYLITSQLILLMNLAIRTAVAVASAVI